jgi:hypothetical protein
VCAFSSIASNSQRFCGKAIVLPISRKAYMSYILECMHDTPPWGSTLMLASVAPNDQAHSGHRGIPEGHRRAAAAFHFTIAPWDLDSHEAPKWLTRGLPRPYRQTCRAQAREMLATPTVR